MLCCAMAKKKRIKAIEEQIASRRTFENELNDELHLVVTTGGIVVTMPGTDFMVGYRKVDRPPWLSVSHLQDDPSAAISQAEFLAKAWATANARARELGWIV
jgi:hypothetical protein